MKLLNKDEGLWLSKTQWRKVFLAVSIITIVLYSVAIVFSLCGSDMFILNYQNAQMDKIEAFAKEHYLMPVINSVLLVIETTILLCFILKDKPKWYYIVSFEAIILVLCYALNISNSLIYTSAIVLFCILVPLIEMLIKEKKFIIKKYGLYLLKAVICLSLNMLLEFMVFVIKAGYFDGVNHIQPLSSAFCYALENDSLSFDAIVRVPCYGSPATLTVVNTGVAITTSNIAVNVEYLD